MPLPPDLLLTLADFSALGYSCSEPNPEAESREYGAHAFEVNGRKAVFRIARTTPKKAGQFVTLWQRAAPDGGPIRPFDSSDGIGLLVVSVRGEAGLGHFIFPQSALIARDVVSREFVGGKRAFRVYPPWSEPSSRTAEATQRWQSEHFLPIRDPAASVAAAYLADPTARCCTRPSTSVANAWAAASSSGATDSGSTSNTVKSARLPTVTDPATAHSPAALAACEV
jgi:hypothetical protein